MMKVILRNIKIFVMHVFLFPGSHSLTVSFLLWYPLTVILNSVVSGSTFNCDTPCSPF